jgi:prepilin signal peptidase PulO-like enzyme (type II secretory pathway)
MLLTLIGALLGLPGGFAIDTLSARLALEWYDSPDDGHGDERGGSDARDGDAADERVRPRTIPFALREGAPYRRLVVVALTVALFGAVWHLYGDRPWQAVIASAYAGVLITCTATDFMARRIANIVTYPAILGALAVGMLAPGADRIDVLLGALLGGGVLFAFALLPGNGIGDAKLGLFMGLALGAGYTGSALVIMALSGGAVAFGILAASRLRARRAAIPYGPYIALGMMAVMLLRGTAFHTI